MKILDLYCGAGGAAMGYHQELDAAGIEHTITGVDIEPQKHYPFDFVLGDAIRYCLEHGAEYDFIHASPPCQGYSRAKPLAKNNYPKLIGATRDAILLTGIPYVIENVTNAGVFMLNPSMLCGEMFGLGTYRHRLFETSFLVPFVMHRGHGLKVDRSSGENRQRDMVQVWGKAPYKGYKARASAAMGIDWMNEEELGEAIPPAYTRWIMSQYLRLAHD